MSRRYAACLSAFASLWMTAAASSQSLSPSVLEISGLKAQYARREAIAFSVRNASKQQLRINVALEYEGPQGWGEALASITDLKHPMGPTIAFNSLKAGEEMRVTFDPGFETPEEKLLRRHDQVQPNHSLQPVQRKARLRVEVDLADGPKKWSLHPKEPLKVWSAPFGMWR